MEGGRAGRFFGIEVDATDLAAATHVVRRAVTVQICLDFMSY